MCTERSKKIYGQQAQKAIGGWRLTPDPTQSNRRERVRSATEKLVALVGAANTAALSLVGDSVQSEREEI
jgi:hypothetical protein